MITVVFGTPTGTCYRRETKEHTTAAKKIVHSLTFKVPNKNCSGRHFIFFLLLSFEENKVLFPVNPLPDDSREMSSLIFSENKEKVFLNVVCCRDLRFKG